MATNSLARYIIFSYYFGYVLYALPPPHFKNFLHNSPLVLTYILYLTTKNITIHLLMRLKNFFSLTICIYNLIEKKNNRVLLPIKNLKIFFINHSLLTQFILVVSYLVTSHIHTHTLNSICCSFK